MSTPTTPTTPPQTGITSTDKVTPTGTTTTDVTLTTTGSSKNPAPAKVIPIGTFENIAFYFGTLFLFAFLLFMSIKMIVGGK
jgi:hypothetical protein